MKYPHARVLVMSKAPDPGQVKTRLIPLLGAEASAEFYRSMVYNTLDTMVSAALCPVELWCTPSTEHSFFIHCRNQYAITLAEQSSGDLGRRMSHAAETALQQAGSVVLIGADCPTLTADDIDTALHALANGSDVVLGPAGDGGYYLIAMHAHHPRLFEDVPWGDADVLAVTEQRLQSLGLACHKLTTRPDLDTPADYRAWCSM